MQRIMKGMDVSSWQGDINYADARMSGIDFVIPRISFSTNVDGKFYRNVEGAKVGGVKIPAVYHFTYAKDTFDATREGKFVVSILEKAKMPKDTIVFYDFEYDTVESALREGRKFGPVECNLFTDLFLDEIEAAGYKTGIYSNIDYYRNWYDKNLLKKHIYWLADLYGQPDYPCHFHQYSFTGKVPGVQGNVDLDYYYGEEVKMEVNPIDEIAKRVIAGEFGNGDKRKTALVSLGYNYMEVQQRVNELLMKG